MSTIVDSTVAKSDDEIGTHGTVGPAQPVRSPGDSKGFVAGVFSGIAKLSGV